MTEERENKPLPDEEIPQADSAQNAPAPEQALPVLLPAPAEESAPDVPSTPESAQEEPESRPILEQIDINELRRRPLNDLQEMAETLPTGTPPPSPSHSLCSNWAGSFSPRAMK